MKSNIAFKNLEPDERLRNLINRQITKLERKAKGFPQDAVFLRVVVEENSARMLDQASITMDVPGKTLASKEERHDIEVSIRDAFVEIERQLMEYKSRMRNEQFWKRLGRREELRKLKANGGPSEDHSREAFFSLLSPHLERVNHLVRHVISYSEQTGELALGEVDPEDVLDGALIRAYEEFRKGAARKDIRSWMIRLAMDELESEVKRAKFDRERTVHIEEDIPETRPTEEVSTLGEEIMYFYQPDEDLKVEDIVPDLEVPTPEQVQDREELRRLMRAALAEMPKEWRLALLFHDVDGRPTGEVAKILRISEREIDRILKNARANLRETLIEYGYGVRRAA